MNKRLLPFWSHAWLFLTFFAIFAASVNTGRLAEPKSQTEPTTEPAAEPTYVPDVEPKIKKFTIYPQAESRLALQHRLVPSFEQRIDGNAATYLGKVLMEEITFFGNGELQDRIDDLRTAPLAYLRSPLVLYPNRAAKPDAPPKNAEAPQETERPQDQWLSDDEGPLYYLDLAARCKTVDWQFRLEPQPFRAFYIPEIQKLRSFGILLAVDARRLIARGRYEEALKPLRNLLALGRNSAALDTLVPKLVGNAIVRAMLLPQLETYIQQPDAPNLYWALTELPLPLVDMRPGIMFEINSAKLLLPELRDVETARRTHAEWRTLFLKTVQHLQRQVWTGMSTAKEEDVESLLTQFTPACKHWLAEHGWTAEALAKLDPAQLVLLEYMRRSEEESQAIGKWALLPYLEYAEKQPAETAQGARVNVHKKDIKKMVQLPTLYGDIPDMHKAEVRLMREFAALRVIEALRMHAAAHGKLPKSLVEITVVPTPLDPVSGKPFVYTLNGETATLTGPELSPIMPFQYEITLGKK